MPRTPSTTSSPTSERVRRPMPQKQPKATPANIVLKTFRRRVRCAALDYTVTRPGPTGAAQAARETAKFGDEVALNAPDQIRYDLEGVLAEPGASRQDVEDELNRQVAKYRAERSVGTFA